MEIRAQLDLRLVSTVDVDEVLAPALRPEGPVPRPRREEPALAGVLA